MVSLGVNDAASFGDEALPLEHLMKSFTKEKFQVGKGSRKRQQNWWANATSAICNSMRKKAITGAAKIQGRVALAGDLAELEKSDLLSTSEPVTSLKSELANLNKKIANRANQLKALQDLEIVEKGVL